MNSHGTYVDNIRMLYEERLDRINQVLEVPDSGKKNELVKKVIIILTAPRGGSTLLKTVLAQHTDLACLLGEQEPFFKITRNTFPFLPDERLTYRQLQNKQALLDSFFAEFTGPGDRNPKDTGFLWRNRLPMQYEYWEYYGELDYTLPDEHALVNTFGEMFASYWDCVRSGAKIPFMEDNVVENPPFVNVGDRHLLSHVPDTILFKSPQDVYRIGLYEQLFPNADIRYIHLSRGFAQSVNGLIDGWLYPSGFHSHDVHMTMKNVEIHLPNYQSNHWWKFDLFPGWEEYTYTYLWQVALAQWRKAHETVLNSGVPALRVKFEDFMREPNLVLRQITEYVGVEPMTVTRLPITMATHDPKVYRWHKRYDLIKMLSGHYAVRRMMKYLGYSMNEEEWT